MTIFYQIGGAQTAIPAVYSNFLVSPSLLAPAAPARDVLLIGEADSGAPGELLDLRGNFFTDFQSVKDFYQSGSIVDAAAMLFSNQPSTIFGGAINRLYVYKTNQSLRASKAIASPTNFGSLVAATYGEDGNTIKSQIKTGQSEMLPTQKFNYLPSPSARSYAVSVNGVVTKSLTVSSGGAADAFVTAMSAATGLSASGGGSVTSITGGPMTATLTTPGGDTLVITQSSGSATWNTSIAVGDTAYIAPTGSALAGASNTNAGSYLVLSVTSTVLTLKRLQAVNTSTGTNAGAFATPSSISIASTDILVNHPVTLTVSATTLAGQGATLELLENSANILGAGMMVNDGNMANILANSTSSIASVTVTVPASGQLTISLSAGSWTNTPNPGDLIRIPLGSPLAGPTNKNVGLLIVLSANGQSITAEQLWSGMTTEAVSSTLLNGNNAALTWAPGFVSTSVAALKTDSAAENAVILAATRASDGTTLPTSLIGGNVVLELGYWNSAATAATVSISPLGMMTITPTGSGLSTITVNLNKYNTIQDLVNYLNSQSGVTASIPDRRSASLSPMVLDQVQGVGILSGQSLSATNGRLKRDYYDWTQFFVKNFSILAFQAGGMAQKAGLPAAEAAPGYLSGAILGGTSNANIQDALDAGLKINVRMVLPLFSRDCTQDIDDGLTDPSSTYTIASTHAAVKAHVSTASSTFYRSERFGMLSIDGNFTQAVQAAATLSYERCQLGFQRVTATGADGSLQTFLPWMEMAAITAGRAQAVLGTSMLRKPFLVSDVFEYGAGSLFMTSTQLDFDPNNQGQLETAIEAGLLVLRPVNGFGVRMESPDLSTRSRNNDPTSWVYERVNVLFTCDEVIQTLRTTLDNFIGNRTSDTPTAVIKTAMETVLAGFIQNGSLLSAKVTSVTSLGNQYTAQVTVTPTEALEAIALTVTAQRSTT